MNSSQKNISLFALAGLFGPALGLLFPLFKLDGFGLIRTIFWPTWMIGWFVMGRNSLADIIIATCVISNIIVFVVLGWIFSKLNFKNKLINWSLLLTIYGSIYGVVHFVVIQFL